MPKIQTTKIFTEISNAVNKGYDVISLQGSSRSSKTYNTVIYIVNHCLTHPGFIWSVVRKTLPSIKGSVFRDFKEVLYKFGVYNPENLNKTEMTYTFENGAMIEFFSSDDEQKLRGRKRDGLFVNEANELEYIMWQQLKMRTTRFSIIDYNPSFGDEHWIAKLNNEKNVYHFITTYRDNPFLEESIVREIESLKTKSPQLWKIYGEGLQAEIEGLIFHDVDFDCEEFPQYLGEENTWIGIDYGYTNDPTAIVRVGYNGTDLYIEEICYRTHMLTNEIVNELKRFDIQVISESADPRMVDEIYSAGVNIWPVKKYPGSIEAGIMKMQEMKIHITKNSSNVKKEFKNYIYAKDKEGRSLNKPVPVDYLNHAIDATRYVVLEKIMGGIKGKFDDDELEKMFY